MNQLEDLLQLCTVKLILPDLMGWGTGFFVTPEWILTCAHVVQEAKGQPVQVRWQNQENWAQAVVERSLPESYDLALLRVTLPTDTNPPCVYLDAAIQSRDLLYLFGYPDQDFPNGCPVTFSCEGLTGDEPALIKFALGQVRPGMSGSPLLNQRTGKVCGIVKFTRDRAFDLGGGAVPTCVILEQFSQLQDLQQQFHQRDRRWRELLPTATHPGETLEAETVQPYLRSLIADEKYQRQWGFYTPTDAIGKLQEPQAATVLDIGLMVQLMQLNRSEDARDPKQQKQEKMEQLPVLDGIRKYAAEHILLMGRPGSGKSTALLRLLVEEAKSALADPSAKIPVLVELRYLDAERPSVLERIGAFLRSHQLSVDEVTLRIALAEGRLLLLIDGVNELPSESARRAVARFRQDYPQTPMIFTTRDVAIGGDVGIEKKLEMQPLSEQQMRQFVQAYLPDQGEPMLRQLQGRLREVGQTPLLLWMLCEVFKGLHQLPSSLGLLFRWFAGEYDKLKQDVPVSEGLRHWQSELLQHLAFIMMQAEEPMELRVAISRQEAETVLAEFLYGKVEYPMQRAKEWLEDLLEHHLIQCTSQNQLEFHHQLLQEYYAAETLLQRLPHLSDEQLKRDYLNYLKWTEPLALMLALVEEEAQAVRVVKLALEVDLMLGGRLAGEMKPDFQEKIIKLVVALEVSTWLQGKLLEMMRSAQVLQRHSQFVKQVENSLNQHSYRGAWKKKELWEETFASNNISSELNASLATEMLNNMNIIDPYFSEFTGEITDLEESFPDLFQALLEPCEPGNNRLKFAVGKLRLHPNLNTQSLIQALKHPNFNIRKNAAYTLGERNLRPVVRELLRLTLDPYASVRISAILTLSRIAPATFMNILFQALLDPISTVRESAAFELGEIGSELAIPKLLQALLDSDPNVKFSVALSLGKIGSETAISGLMQALHDTDSNVRWSAASALSRIGSEAAIPELLQALQHSDADVRACAAFVLGRIASEKAVPALQKALDDVDYNARWAATEALEKIYPAARAIYLPSLLRLISSNVEETASEHVNVSYLRETAVLRETALGTIRAIQNHCKFYNYDLKQKEASRL